jgi:PAS domain S-box-containing protein
VSNPVASRPRPVLTAFLVAGLYIVISGAYISLSDRLLARFTQADVGRLVHLQTVKGLGFVALTGIALFLLVWRLNLAWRRTARAEAHGEAERAHSETLFRDGPDAALIVGEDGRVESANLAAGDLFGSRPGELVGRLVGELSGGPGTSGSDSHLLALHGRELALDGGSKRRRWRCRRLDGSEFEAEASFALLPGTPSRVLAWLRDITDQQATSRELAAANEQLRLLVEGTSHFFFYLQDLEGKLTYVSPTIEEITGRKVQEWLGQGHWFAAASPINDHARLVTARHLAGEFDGKPVQVETTHADGHPVLLEAYESGRYRDGALVGLQGIAHDISERRQAERVQAAIYRISEAANSAANLQELFPAIHHIVGELMPAHNFYIALYDAAADLIKFPYFIDEIDPPPTPRKPRKGLTEYVLRTGEPLLASPEVALELETRGDVELIGAPSVDWLGAPLTVKDHTFGVLVVQSYTEGTRYSDAQKEILRFVSTQVAMAIERTRAEQALRESEERYRALVELSPDGIAIHSEGRIVFANARGAKILGYASVAEVIGKPIVEMIHPDDRELVRRRVQRAVASGTPQPPVEERFLRADGSVIDVEVASIPFVYQAKPAVLVVVRDISERRKVQEHLRQSQKLEAVGQLAGGVAHDFNNLLQALLSTVQVMRFGNPSPKQVAATIAELEAHIKRGAALTRQLLLFARREVTRAESCDLVALVEDTGELLRRLVPENVHMALRLDPVPLPVRVDRGQLEQVLVNLVVNACDAMPDGGKLTVRSGSSEGAEAWLEVEDNGSGVPDALREKIFEPFFTTKLPGKGSGLGLSVVHGIVSRHGGRVTLSNSEGGGSTFRVMLPLAKPGRSARAVPAPLPPATPSAGGESVLLVEDEAATRDALRDVLEALGYRVESVDSAEAAEELARASRFDVLLTDLMLPGIHGGELAQRLVRRWPDLRVIVMSGYTEDEAIRRGVGEGTLRFLQKPFDMGALASELRAALAEAKA